MIGYNQEAHSVKNLKKYAPALLGITAVLGIMGLLFLDDYLAPKSQVQLTLKEDGTWEKDGKKWPLRERKIPGVYCLKKTAVLRVQRLSKGTCDFNNK